MLAAMPYPLALTRLVTIGALGLACDPPLVQTAGGLSPSAEAGPDIVIPFISNNLQDKRPASSDQLPPVHLPVHLIPFGPVPQETLEHAAQGLEQHAPVHVTLHEERPFPEYAKSSRKGAYQASRLLDALASFPHGGQLLGITEADIVTRKVSVPVWRILGMGAIDGRVCVISTYRMRRRWEGRGASEALVRERLWKTAIHELGHTLGLEHCPKVGCLMEDGHGTVKTIDRDTALCDECARKFEASLLRNAQHKSDD